MAGAVLTRLPGDGTANNRKENAMEEQVLVVVLDADCSTRELAERIENIRQMPGIVAVRTIEGIVADAKASKSE
jgi:nitrate reductase NapAB chaperone NapD